MTIFNLFEISIVKNAVHALHFSIRCSIAVPSGFCLRDRYDMECQEPHLAGGSPPCAKLQTLKAIKNQIRLLCLVAARLLALLASLVPRGRVTIDRVNQLTQSIEFIESNSLASICDRKRNLCQIFVFEADLSQRRCQDLDTLGQFHQICLPLCQIWPNRAKVRREYSGQLSADRFMGYLSPVRYGGRRT